MNLASSSGLIAGTWGENMIDVKDAAATAGRYLKDFFPGAKSIQIEEVELSEDRSLWRITLSYTMQDSLIATGYQIVKHYKIFTIKTDSGEVLSMKIREIK